MKFRLPIFRSRKRKNSPAPEPRHEQQSGPYHLPLELHFLILDHLPVDVDRRPFCCVCRAWAAHLQFFIFKDMFVTPQIFSRLAALFDTHPHFGGYIITLRVAHGNVDFLKKIVTLLPVMPNLHQLDTISWTFDGLDPSQLEFVAPLAGITHLRLCTTIFSTAQTALRFLSLFPHLNSLDIIGRWMHSQPYFADTEDISVNDGPGRLHLNNLTLDMESCPRSIVAWLIRDVTVDNMLLLGWIHDDLFSKIGSGLKDLHIETRVEHRPPGPVDPIRHCTALRSLRIAPPGYASPVSIIVLLLSKVTSSSLTHLYVDTFVGPKHLELSWHEVDQALATLGSLQEVVFDLCGMFDASGGAEYLELVAGMRAQMAQADARGFLHFKCGGRKEDTGKPAGKSKSPPKAKKSKKPPSDGGAVGYETDDGYVSSSGKPKTKGRLRFFSLRRGKSDSTSESPVVEAVPPMPEREFFPLPIADRFATTLGNHSTTWSTITRWEVALNHSS